MKKRKCRTKQLIDGQRFLREQYLSLKIYRNFGEWVSDVECKDYLCEKFREWGVVYDALEIHFYTKNARRTTNWIEWSTVVEVFMGFDSAITMEAMTKLIYAKLTKYLFLRTMRDFRIFPGQFREKPTHFTPEDIRMLLL